MTPVGWIMIAIAAIAGAAYLIYKNWGPIKDFFIGLWAGVKNAFGSAADWITGKFNALLEWVRGAIVKVADMMPGWVKKYTLPGLAVSKMADSIRPTGAPAAPGGKQRNDVGGTIHVKIDSEGRPRVAQADSNNRNVGFDVDAGYTMFMP